MRVIVGLAIIVGWILGFMMGTYMGRLLPSSRYFDVLSSWWTLNVSHRGEVFSIRVVAQYFGMPMQIIHDPEVSVVVTSLAALASTMVVNRSRAVTA